MNLQLQIRIAARDDFDAIYALKVVGGEIKDGPHPKFIFKSELQRTEYEKLLRRLEEENAASNKGSSRSKAAPRRYPAPVGGTRLVRNGRIYNPWHLG